MGHFVSSHREREKRDGRDSRGDEKEGQARKGKMNEVTERFVALRNATVRYQKALRSAL